MTPDTAPFHVYFAHVVGGFAVLIAVLVICAVALHYTELRLARRRRTRHDRRVR